MALLNLIPGELSHISVFQAHVRPAVWAALAAGQGAGFVQGHCGPCSRVVGEVEARLRGKWGRGGAWRRRGAEAADASSAPFAKALFPLEAGSRPLSLHLSSGLCFLLGPSPAQPGSAQPSFPALTFNSTHQILP